MKRVQMLRLLPALLCGGLLMAATGPAGALGLALSKAQGNGSGIVLAGLLVGAWGLYLRRRPGRVLIDKETGEEEVLRPRHSLFWIPVLYWWGADPAGAGGGSGDQGGRR